MQQTRLSLAELTVGMEKMPQVLLNVEVKQRFDPAEVPAIMAVQQRVEAQLAGEGRVIGEVAAHPPLGLAELGLRPPAATPSA